MDKCRLCDRYAIGCEPTRYSDGTRLRHLQRNAAERFCTVHHPRINAARVASRAANRTTCVSSHPRQPGHYTVGGARRKKGDAPAPSAMCLVSLPCKGQPRSLTSQVQVVKLKAATLGDTRIVRGGTQARCLSLRDFRKSTEAA